MDALATAFAAGYGVFMGTYPVPIKAPRVQAANIHPLVFQCYKSFWVMVTGFMFAVPVYASGRTLHLTWWAIASAFCWVPSGLCTITAVMLNGVSLTIVINSATAAVGSFLVFWLVLGEALKPHVISGHSVYLAPVWLVGCVFGMVAIVYGPELVRTHCRGRCRKAVKDGIDSTLLDGAGLPSTTADESRVSTGRFVLGVVVAMLAGVFAAAQYAVVTIGKGVEQRRAGCEHNVTLCPDALTESFNPLGSWSFMFGIGAAVAAAALMAILCAYRLVLGRKPLCPSLELRVMWVPGTVAGLFWVVGNLCGELAVLRGGNSVEVPTMTSIQLIMSGAWGIVWYREVTGRGEVAVWIVSAVWTLAMVLLLGMEKSK